jgi:hypothetical protein
MTVKQTLFLTGARGDRRASVSGSRWRARLRFGRTAPWYPVAVKLDDHLEVGLGWRTSVEQGVRIKDRY